MAWWEVKNLHKDLLIRNNGSQKATMSRPINAGDQTTKTKKIKIQNYRCNKIYQI